MGGSEDGTTVLHSAALGGHVSCLSILLESGAEVNAEDDLGHTPLLAAACNGHNRAMQILLENWADADVEDVSGRSARDFEPERIQSFEHEQAQEMLGTMC